MSTVTVVATVEASNFPPRVRLNVTDTGSSPAYLSTTVTRLNPNGTTEVVRTQDGNPLQLTTSGSTRVGLLYDYSAPFQQQVTYSTLESPTVLSAPVTVPESRVWLIHPGVPAISMPVTLLAGSLLEETRSVQQGVFRPMGRANPVIVTDGRRNGIESTLIIGTETPPELAALLALIDDAGTLLLNIPSTLGFGMDSAYIAVSDVRVARRTTIGSDPYRDVTLPFVVVDRPAGGSQSERNYVNLLDFASYADLRAAYTTYADVLAGP